MAVVADLIEIDLSALALHSRARHGHVIAGTATRYAWALTGEGLLSKSLVLIQRAAASSVLIPCDVPSPASDGNDSRRMCGKRCRHFG